MKYIDADKLIAEINKRLMAVDLETLRNFGCHRVWAYNDVKDLITSLQQEQPEVDLKKVVMIDNVIMNMTAEGYNNGYKTRPFYEEVLRRLNARKEE